MYFVTWSVHIATYATVVGFSYQHILYTIVRKATISTSPVDETESSQPTSISGLVTTPRGRSRSLDSKYIHVVTMPCTLQ